MGHGVGEGCGSEDIGGRRRRPARAARLPTLCLDAQAAIIAEARRAHSALVSPGGRPCWSRPASPPAMLLATNNRYAPSS